MFSELSSHVCGLISNRDRGTNERTWTIVLYLKGFGGHPETSVFNFCLLEFSSQGIRDSQRSGL